MPIHFRSLFTLKYKGSISEKLNFFGLESGGLFVKILPIEKFEEFYELERKSEEESFKEVFGKELNKIEKEFSVSLENEKITSSRNAL